MDDTDSPKPWASAENDFPQYLWFKFEVSHVLTKIGFSTRSDRRDSAAGDPKKFDVIASQDCNQFNVLLHVEDAAFLEQYQAKAWEIPEEKQAPYLCIGIKVHSIKGYYKYQVTAVQNMIMWEKRF